MAVDPSDSGPAGAVADDAESLDTISASHLEVRLGRSSVPLGFVREGPTVYLAARDASAAWPVTVLRDGRAVLRIGDRSASGPTRLVVEDGERDRILALFARKYGPSAFARWYARPARLVAIDTDAPAPPARAEGVYRDWLEAEFDNVARDYDRHILGNRMNRLLRDRSLARLRAEFGSHGRLLEIGCGSGMETLRLLEDGHEIVALDISERMLSVVREKARAAGLSERLSTVHAAAADLERVGPSVAASGRCDGAYSTYGAMNCEPDLTAVARGLHPLLAPAARFLAGVYNRWCAVETFGYALTGAFDRARGRWGSPVAVGSSRFCVDVFAHSAASFRTEFAPWFRAVRWEAVPLFLPPSDLTAYAEKFSRRFDRLARWDRSLGQLPGLRSLGDHFLMVLERRDRPASRAG